MNPDATVWTQRSQTDPLVQARPSHASSLHTPVLHASSGCTATSTGQRMFEMYRWRNESIVATYHRPTDVAERTDIALVLVNAGPAPRAGNSDLSRRVADQLARSEFPVFRLDFPGIGDSTGDSFKRIEDFRIAAQESPLDDVLAEVVEQICVRHGVDRVVLGGLCAGAVVCVRAARRMGRRCAGLLLLEPDFLHARVASQVTWRNPRAFTERVLRGLARRRSTASVARAAQRTYEWFDRGRMPDGIARDVVDAWIDLTEVQVPTFLAVADGANCDTLCARIALAADVEVRRMTMSEFESEDVPNSALVTCFALGNTNHLFTAGEAPEALPLAIETWMQRFA